MEMIPGSEKDKEKENEKKNIYGFVINFLTKMTRKVVYLLKTFQMSCFHIQ
jgi:hypothetical protein